MKIRTGFVSNSSSSSFVCEICGEEESGWDISLTDCDFFECVNGHVICRDDLLEDYDPSEYEEGDPEYDPDMSAHYYMPEKYCPICQFVEPDQSLVGKYLGNLYNITKDEVFKVIKAQNKRRKKLYDGEYVSYIMSKYNLNQDELLKSLKEKYTTFKEFMKSLKEN